MKKFLLVILGVFVTVCVYCRDQSSSLTSMAQMFSTVKIILALLRIRYLTGQQFEEYFVRVIRTSKLQRIGKHAVLLTSRASVESKTVLSKHSGPTRPHILSIAAANIGMHEVS